MREFNVQEDFSVSVAQFFDLIFLSPKFKLDFHIKRGDTEISVGDWKELGSNKCERAIKFCSPVSDQAILKKLTGGMSPVVHEKQDYELIDNRELRVLSQATSSAGGFNCATIANYIITELPPRPSPSPSSSTVASPACHVDIVVKSEFKSRLFKGQVENMMNQMATQTFEQWVALVKEKVADFHKEERAKNKLPTIQPHSQSPQPLPEFLTDTLSGTVSEYDTDDDSYYDAQDQLFTSPPSSRTSTPPPHHDIRHIGSNSSSHSNSNSTTSNVAFSMPPTSGLTAVIHSLQREIQNLRSMTEVNASRLLGLENSNYPASPLPPHPNNNTNNSNNKNIPSPGNDGLLPYLQRLEILAKQQEEETARSREMEQEWKSKCRDLEAKIDSNSNNNNGKKIVVGWWGVVFILVWPVVAHKLWKYANLLRPVVVRAFWQMLGK